MADDTTSQATPAPTETQAPAAPPPVAATPPAVPVAAAPDTEPSEPGADSSNWLPARLERERRKVFEELGLESADDAKAAIKAYKDAEDASKSEVQKLTEKNEQLKAKVDKLGELESAMKVRADQMLKDLTDDQRLVVDTLAAGDATKTVAAIEALKKTWIKPAADPAAENTPSTNTSAPAPNAPAETQTSDVDHKARYAEIQEQNPFLAPAYLKLHRKQIYPQT